MRKQGYYIYIITNQNRTVLYTGITNSLVRRLAEHSDDALSGGKHFAGKYQCFYLLYYECYQYVLDATARKKR